MPTLTINGHETTVPAGATILDAARQLGIDVPTLCFLEGHPPNVSCMLCAVEVAGTARLVPSCAAPAAEGMVVQTESELVRESRRVVLDLLLSHHAGDCEAPCTIACPASLHIPRMLRRQQRGETAQAAHLALEALVLPRTLGCICPAPCEKVCRRQTHDGAVAIPALHRTAAESQPVQADPPLAPSSGKRVAVVGAGPAGLAAAFALCRMGHAVDLFDNHDLAGGALRSSVERDRLPLEALDVDLATVFAQGVRFHGDTRLADGAALEALQAEHDAVVLATGAGPSPEQWGLAAGPHGVTVDRASQMTSRPGVFAAGGVVREIKRMAVRAVASGRNAAEMVDRFLRGSTCEQSPRQINVSMGRTLREGEMERFLETAHAGVRSVPETCRDLLPDDVAAAEAGRCLHCDCRAAENCRLRDYATAGGANPARWRDKRPTFEHDLSHPDIIYEPGKCIACGLCIRISKEAGEKLGTTFLGRGIAVRVAPPLRESLAAALTVSANACVEACPTGALAFRDTRS